MSSSVGLGRGDSGDKDRGDDDKDGGDGTRRVPVARVGRRARLLLLLVLLAVALGAAGLLLRGDETESRLAVAESRLRAASPDGALSLDGADVTELYVAPGALPGVALGDPLEAAIAAGLTRSGPFGEAGCWFLSPTSHVDAASERLVPMPPVDWREPSVTAWAVDGEIVSLQVHTPSGERVPTWLGVGPGDPADEAAALPDARQSAATAARDTQPAGPTGPLEVAVTTVPSGDRDGELEVLLAAAGDPAVVSDRSTLTTMEMRRPSAAACELPPSQQGVPPLLPITEELVASGVGQQPAGPQGQQARAVVGPDGTAEVRFGADVADLLDSGQWQLLDLGAPAAEEDPEAGEAPDERSDDAGPDEWQQLVPAGSHDDLTAAGNAHVDGVAMVEALGGAVTALWLVEGRTSEGLAVGEPVSRLGEVYPGVGDTDPSPDPLGVHPHSVELDDGRVVDAYPGAYPVDVPGVDVRVSLVDPPVVVLRVASVTGSPAVP